MADVTAVSEVLNSRLGGTRVGISEVAESKSTDLRVLWLEGQLRNIELQIMHMLVDLESGFSIEDLGLGSEADFMEAMDELAAEINQLRSLIQVCRSIGR